VSGGEILWALLKGWSLTSALAYLAAHGIWSGLQSIPADRAASAGLACFFAGVIAATGGLATLEHVEARLEELERKNRGDR